MKKFLSVNALVGLLVAVALTAGAAPGDVQQPDQAKAKVQTAFQKRVDKSHVLGGKNDLRVITPDMDARQKVEVQREIKRRAKARRNSLIQAAEAQRAKMLGEQGGPVQPK